MAISSQESDSKDCTLVAWNDDDGEALPKRLGRLRPIMQRRVRGIPKREFGEWGDQTRIVLGEWSGFRVKYSC